MLSRGLADRATHIRRDIKERELYVSLDGERGKAFAYWAFFLGAALFWTVLVREDDGAAVSTARPFRY